jgi:divalent metal cation (Fe/Co/Zn/Cd) transporter
MTKRQKVGFVVSEWVVALFLLYVMFALGIHFVLSDSARTLSDYLVEAAVILGVAVLLFGPIVLTKWLSIRRSKQRTLATDATAASGLKQSVSAR